LPCNFLHQSALTARHISLVQSILWVVCFLMSHSCKKCDDSLIMCLIQTRSWMMLSLVPLKYDQKVFHLNYKYVCSGYYNCDLLLTSHFLLIPFWVWDPVLTFWQWHRTVTTLLFFLVNVCWYITWIHLSFNFIFSWHMSFSWHYKLHKASPIWLQQNMPKCHLHLFWKFTAPTMSLYPQNNSPCAVWYMYSRVVWVLNLCSPYQNFMQVDHTILTIYSSIHFFSGASAFLFLYEHFTFCVFWS
jgi:hypothetical protein